MHVRYQQTRIELRGQVQVEILISDPADHPDILHNVRLCSWSAERVSECGRSLPCDILSVVSKLSEAIVW